MGENGNDDDRGSKDNTGREHKPDHAKDNENAPTGSLGTNRITTPSLGLGGSSQQNRTAQPVEQTQQSQPVEDTRPIAFKTGDKVVDQDSEAKGQQLMTEDEIKAKARGQDASQEQEGPRVSQSDYAKAFRQASDKTKQMQKSNENEIGN